MAKIKAEIRATRLNGPDANDSALIEALHALLGSDSPTIMVDLPGRQFAGARYSFALEIAEVER